jgi:hypothetical protein
MDKLERMMATIGPIGGIGLGLWISVFLERDVAVIIGVHVIFTSAVLLSILSYLRNKELMRHNE